MAARNFFPVVIAISLSALLSLSLAAHGERHDVALVQAALELAAYSQNNVALAVSAMSRALDTDLCFNYTTFANRAEELHADYFASNYLSEPAGVVFDLNTTLKLHDVKKYLADAIKFHPHLDLSACDTDSYALDLCDDTINATELPLDTARAILQTEVVRSNRCTKALDNLSSYVASLPSKAFHSAASAACQNAESGFLVPGFHHPPSWTSWADLHFRFFLLGSYLNLVLAADPWLCLSPAAEHSTQSVQGGLQRKRDAVLQMVMAASFPAKASDWDLMGQEAELRADFARVLGKRGQTCGECSERKRKCYYRNSID